MFISAKMVYQFTLVRSSGLPSKLLLVFTISPCHATNARTLKKLRKSKGDDWIKQWFSSIAPLYKMGTQILRGSEFFPLRSVTYSFENHFYHIMRPPLNVTIFNTNMRNYVMAATPMCYTLPKFLSC